MTPIVLNDHSANKTVMTDQQPQLLHAQWHKISGSTGGNRASMSLIVVYEYDVFYIPWALMASTDTDVTKNNVTANTTGTSNTTSSSIPSSTITPKIDNVEKDHNKTSNDPWPHGPVRRITTSGSSATVPAVGTVSNGVADYLYESK